MAVKQTKRPAAAARGVGRAASARRRIPRFLWLLILGCLWSGGCKTSQPSSDPVSLTAPEEKSDKVTPQKAADVHYWQGRRMEAHGDLDAAAAYYQEAVKRDPSRADAYLRLAVLHDRHGKFNESAEFYKKALAAKPGDAEVFNSMGYSYYLQQRWAESEIALRQAIAIHPDHRKAHNNLGKLLARAERRDEALAEFRKGGCSEADAHANLAFHLTLENNWADARKHYERALTVEPSSAAARKGLEELDKLTVKLEKGPGGAPAVPASHTVSEPKP